MQTEAATQNKYTHEEQISLHAKWKASGKSQAAFCREEGIPYAVFSYWHKRISKNTPKSKPLFTRAKVVDVLGKGSSPAGRLILPNGVRVDIFSEVTLTAFILDAMRAPC